METTIYYTAKEAARKLGISTQTFYRWAKRKWIYTTKLPNGTLRISEESLADIMAEHKDLTEFDVQELVSSVLA